VVLNLVGRGERRGSESRLNPARLHVQFAAGGTLRQSSLQKGTVVDWAHLYFYLRLYPEEWMLRNRV